MARVEALELLTLYSALVDKDNEALKDQLKKHKLLGKSKTKFTVTQPNRTAPAPDAAPRGEPEGQ